MEKEMGKRSEKYSEKYWKIEKLMDLSKEITKGS
jgi:hypothetical protein